MSKKKRLIVPFYVNHKGCPERCVFCDQDSITGEEGAIPRVDAIKAEISSYLESWHGEGRREVAFYGGTFTGLGLNLQEELLGAVAPFIESGEIDAIRVSTRPDAIDDKRLDLLEGYGVETIELGVQSMDDEVLKLSGRGHRSRQTGMAADLIRARGFTLGCQLMPGLPGDSFKKSIDSALQVAHMGAAFVRIYPTLVIRGTKLERMFLQGSYAPQSMEDALHLCSEMVEIFRVRGIDVIRVGLQPEESLSASLISGPYHPAFGEMVESLIFMKKARRLLSGCTSLKEGISFLISPYDESAFRGQKNMNMKGLRTEFPHVKFAVKKDAALAKGSLLLH